MYVKQDGYIEKASKLSEGEVEFVVSTGAIDSQGERINVEGINLKDYKKNPVILWAHDGFNLPIARTEKIWVENGKLMARAKFYMKDEFPRKVYNYIVDGFLKACSIGGQITDFAPDGMTISEMIMKEFSVVSIGSNAEALVANKGFKSDDAKELNGLANMYARKVLTLGEDELNKNIDMLEGLVTALKEVATSAPIGGEVDESIRRRVVLRSAQAVDSQVETVIRQIKLKGNS